ncbi:FAD-dependent oxidoreductase [Clostridia bacterium OttesenSCG-928-O13]|nr:FAD-dependent oxidoreductase [Clostridia bacterium OttesenSCG-928-O13]
MARVLVIGAGVAGCAAAFQMAQKGLDVTLVEKKETIGGRVRAYGCKATDKCNNCGVCLVGGLWEKVEKNPRIETVLSSVVTDLSGSAGDFSATVKTPDGPRYFSRLDSVVVSTGFEGVSSGESAHLQIEGTKGIITGSQIEAVMLDRTKTGVLAAPPQSVAFIQCFGSRDEKERANYCSRVCCSYSTRAAKVLRHYYPECKIVFFYMELQNVANRDYYRELGEENIEFVKCRPLKITGGAPATIQYDDPEKGMQTRTFDMVVLSEGIHPTADAAWMAATYGLSQDDNGFLRAVEGREGVHVSGCAKTPLKIDESYADSMAVANTVAAGCHVCGG